MAPKSKPSAARKVQMKAVLVPAVLRENEYQVNMNGYDQYLFHELRTLFSWVASVHGLAPWKGCTSRKGASKRPGERIFLLQSFGRRVTTQQAIDWGNENGYFVANREEAIQLADWYVNLQIKLKILALGSYVFAEGKKCYALLATAGSGTRDLVHGRSDGTGNDGWPADITILYVRKETPVNILPSVKPARDLNFPVLTPY